MVAQIHNRKRKMYEKAEHALRKGAGGLLSSVTMPPS